MERLESRMSALEERLAAHERENDDQLENIDEENLAFIPVKNSGGTNFTLRFEADGGRLLLCSGGKRYSITLKLEE